MLLEYINYLWIMFLNYGNGCFKYCPKFREEKKKLRQDSILRLLTV